MVFDSHVFCHDCHESNMVDGESAFLNMELAASAMTDTELQQQIFEPFYHISFGPGSTGGSYAFYPIENMVGLPSFGGWRQFPETRF